MARYKSKGAYRDDVDRVLDINSRFPSNTEEDKRVQGVITIAILLAFAGVLVYSAYRMGEWSYPNQSAISWFWWYI